MAGTTWPALTAGEKATASKVEAKFDWIEGSLVPMLGGAKTTGAYDLGEASYCWGTGYINNIVSQKITNSNTMQSGYIAVQTIWAQQMSVTSLYAVNIFSTTAKEITLDNVKTRYCVLGPGNFVAGENIGTYKVIITPNYVNVYTLGSNVIAPVNLPQGASITAFKVWYYLLNVSDPGDIYFDLCRAEHTSTSYTTMGSLQNGTAGSGYYNTQTTALTLTSIDNSQYMYSVYAENTRGGSPVQIHGALITYEIKGTLPLL